MKLDTNEFLAEFLDEVNMYLNDLDGAILNLESAPENKEYLNDIFRIAHSIKGISAMMGFDKLEKLTHSMEDVLYDIRDGKAMITKEIIDLLLLCHDFLHKILLEIGKTGTEENIKIREIDSLIGKLHNLLDQTKTNVKNEVKLFKGLKISKEKAKELRDDLTDEKIKLYYISSEIEKECEMKKVRAFMILNDLKDLGKILKSYPTLEELKDNEYNIEDSTVHILLDSKIKEKKIKEKIQKISNVESFEIDEIKDIKNIIECEEETIDKFLEEEIIGSHEVKENYDEVKENRYNQDFVIEIEKGLLKLKRKLLKFGDEDNQDLIQECYNDIKKINSIALSIKQPVIESLTKVVLEIINRYKEEHVNLESRLIDFILDLVEFGLRWSENPELDKDLKFMNEVQKQTSKMEEYILEQKIDPEDKIGEILQKIANLTDEDIQEIKKMQEENPDKKFGELAVDSKKVNEEDTIKAIRLQKRKRSKSNKPVISLSNYIRVDSKKADELVENVGELKIIQTQIEHLLMNNIGLSSENRKARHNNMKKVVRMQRVMKKIQEISMSFRLVPLRSTFQKINRTVRDTLNKLDKDVNFKMSGEETEIDKEIADKILKLIMHLVKNSIGHGIESQQERVSKGKPKKGEVELSAYQDKGFIHIEISDDGKGIDKDAIYSSAKKKGLIDPAKDYSDKEKINFIFYPGFSTASEVGAISGRGVGMDVVKTELEKMGGKINIETKVGKGTVFEMKIPINMSIINGTVINISKQSYIMPNIYIKEVVRKKDEYWVDVKGKRNTIKIREKIIPVIDLEKIFDHEINTDDAKMFMILEVGDKTKAILVDDILERREVVEKPLGEEFKHLEYVSGASILGDGKVSLIINAERL